MKKLFYLFLFLFLYQSVSAQQEAKVFCLARVQPSDSSLLQACKKLKVNSITVKILMYRGSVIRDSIYRDIYVLRQWKDSVTFSFMVPVTKMAGVDSMQVNPVYHFECDQGDQRGPTYIDKAGISAIQKFIHLKLKSDPTGAIVYLIPKYLWDTNARLRKKKAEALDEYRVAAGTTPVWTQAQEYVYITLFQTKKQFVSVQCSPVYSQPIDSVFAQFSMP
jgi:hypothetical protein